MQSLWLLALRLGASTAFSPAGPPPGPRVAPRRAAHADEISTLVGTAGRRPSVILIDADNVRGKSNWALSAADLARAVSDLARAQAQPVAVVFDHAERRDACLVHGTCALAFAGPVGNADDALVDAVEWWAGQDGATIALVTSDFGLRARASQAAVRGATKPLASGALDQPSKGKTRARLRFVSSYALVEVLRGVAAHKPAPSYCAPFAAAHRHLAFHVNAAPKPKRPKGMAPKPKQHDRAVITAELTWMRVILAERLRQLTAAWRRSADGALLGVTPGAPLGPTNGATLGLADGAPLGLPADGADPGPRLLEAFAAAFRGPDVADGPSRVLQHPLADRKQRSSLVNFALWLQKHDEEPDEPKADDAPPEPAAEASESISGKRPAALRPGARRGRRKRGSSSRLPIPPASARERSWKARLASVDADQLELDLAAWLRGEGADQEVLQEAPSR
ncbi:hypothetical protein M885DRAFT_591451 [Pelagophyceae sp. CCMP2097]|nr:hypothetical protein M885DRAFT_591451 [Pelagophyceae sp. CCMP2097]|mmetsp:Transcript_6663/g.23821  ORF Transcript_6663/g.23821 Transcript_6663/m.23821 type:complete len:452 (+) Transcript_6663:140-1495(+)